jgi:hypothetical protein
MVSMSTSSCAAATALALVLIVADVSDSAAQARDGLGGKPIDAARPDTIACAAGGFLTGWTVRQTDRIVGIARFDCVKATPQQAWDTESLVQNLGFGDVRHGASATKSCPRDYFVVGFAAKTGSYSADTHGMAKPEPPRMLADLSPVCRDRRNASFTANVNALTQAEDNRLQDVAWDGLGGARSCRAGYAAVKISFSYDGRRDIDPANRFYDASLTCRRLPVQIVPTAVPRHQ